MHTKHYFAILLLVIVGSCQLEQNKEEEKQLFYHHVFFWLHNPDNPDDRADFEQGISELVRIPEILSCHIGVPAETGYRDVVDDSYTYSYLVFFSDVAAHDIYQAHPVHKQFVENYQHLWEKVRVYDAIKQATKKP